MRILNQQEYKEYRKKVPMPEVTTNLAVFCGCGRMYASYKEENELLCPLCFVDLSNEELKLLYQPPLPQSVRELFTETMKLLGSPES